MKRYPACGALCAALLLLVAGAAWAADRTATSDGMPVILASLPVSNVTILDDQAAAAIRGQGDVPLYVLVKILGFNALDYGGVNWTWNLLGYRYGYWGGPGWSSAGDDFVDDMDELFMMHDKAYTPSATNADKRAADIVLLEGLAKGLRPLKSPRAR
jgi:hypothetical protein